MDMDNPFFWSRPSVRPSTFRGIPVYSPQPEVQQRRQPVKTSSATPKVVQIPVHFVGSEPSRSASALKIQRVFRGFLVRRSVKRIIAIRRDVDEIERKLSRCETLDLIRRDERERLRVNEMLMALLLKLDSVRGVDSGVRDCRRAVIKKAIALQERVDAIVSPVDQSDKILGQLKDSQKNAEALAQNLKSTVTDAQNSVEHGNQIEESAIADFDRGPQETSGGKDVGQGELLYLNPVADNCERVEVGGDFEVNAEEEDGVHEAGDGICEVKEYLNQDAGQGALLEDLPDSENSVADNRERVEVGGDDLEVNAEEKNRAQETGDGISEVEESVAPPEMKVENENCIDSEVVDNVIEVEADFGTRVKEEERCVEKEGESCHETLAVNEGMEESMETSQMETLTEGGEVNDVSLKGVEESEQELKGGTDDNKRSRELLERMMEDNEKMMNLMSQLCERNEMQTRMLNALTQRVEQLEKAFVCHRLRRKKGRHSALSV